MRVVVPGRPQSKLQAVSTACWEGRQIITYISGHAIVVLDGPNSVLQTTYTDLPDELVAIVIDELSGKIAAASSNLVHVYKPDGYFQGSPRWSLQCHLPAGEQDEIRSLHWGLDEELLIGSTQLSLFSTHNAADHLWSKSLATPAKIAQFSYDTSLIATTGQYDRLVKIWRKLSLSDQRFEYDYLPHPTVVTGICWRRPYHRDQSFDNILYTFCADNKLRIWSPGDSVSHHILQFWGEIDLMQSIQPRTLNPADVSSQRFAFMIHSRDFSMATEKAVQDSPDDEHEQMALHHLIEIANRSPEVCVVLDEKGNMSAWGLENVGSKHRVPGDIFNVAHVEGLALRFKPDCVPIENNAQFFPFCGDDTKRPFSLLVHHFDGRLEWYEGKLDQFFSPLSQSNRLSLKCSWSGHSGEIKKVIRSVTGKAIVSRTKQNESIVWTQAQSARGITIRRSSIIGTQEHVHRAWVLQDGKFVVFLHHGSISLWDTRSLRAIEITRKQYSIKGKALCLLYIPGEDHTPGMAHMATVSSEMQGISWEVRLPTEATPVEPSLEQFDTFDLGLGDDLAFVLSVDPAGTAPVISGFLDTLARDVAISYTNSGRVTSWTAKVDLINRKTEWLTTAEVETLIEYPYLASGTSIRKTALVNSEQTQLTIWSTKGQALEYEERFSTEQGQVQDLDWSSTPDNQSILAVGFPHKVIIYGQLRFDYLDDRPAWAAFREIDALQFTSHPIGDSVWLGGGNFAIGAGNQLFIIEDKLTLSENLLPDIRLSAKSKETVNIFDLVSRLNGPLPIYHPQYLSQFILDGKVVLVQRILLKLWRFLKFYTEGDDVDPMLGFSIDDISDQQDITSSLARKELNSSYADLTEDEPEVVTEHVVASLNELLSSRTVPLLSSREQFLLADAVECVGTVEKHRRSIDENACRFLLFFRQYALRHSQHTDKHLSLSWREITWAFHSSSQDILADLVSRHYHNKMLWEHARASGLFMWMSDLPALRTQFETIARNEYTKTEDKDPVNCSLYYLALKKKAILSGLWRMAIWSKEQATTQKFLSNNFNEQRWKTAALKNAYALMGKRRFEYAAAFFLLADHLKDAINILSNQMGDIQLAIAVCRVYEGDHGPVLSEFLTEKVLPEATLDGNRCLATWALWMLGKRDKAVRALILPLPQVLSPPETPKMESKLFSIDDPALVVLYKQLREKSLQALRGAMSISPRAEWEFVIHTARLYSRMGCDLLALELVRSWEFLITPGHPISPALSPSTTSFSKQSLHLPSHQGHQPPSPMLSAFDMDPRLVLRRRSSLVVDDLPQELKRHSITDEPTIDEEVESNGMNGHDKKSTEKEKAPKQEEKKKPTQFQEPDANSLLDAFGF
ncbi:WD repeat protein-like protein [Microthyrium microscopicum]|uniref:WD repeat protein-like protein n=1 Tax=Microthyrium microscopicum TaxID=703497 RepID=A0A6A6UTV0_9PEZI|nr:WD repeat protein-like protein [Microthyrium microscopicum]